jgi:hypothetical protein
MERELLNIYWDTKQEKIVFPPMIWSFIWFKGDEMNQPRRSKKDSTLLIASFKSILSKYDGNILVWFSKFEFPARTIKQFIQFLGIMVSILRGLYKYQTSKVEKILKDSPDLIPSPSPSVKIQIMGGKICMRCKGKTLLGIVNKLLLLTSPSNVLPYTSSKLYRQFSLKVKVIGSNPGYLLKSFLL